MRESRLTVTQNAHGPFTVGVGGTLGPPAETRQAKSRSRWVTRGALPFPDPEEELLCHVSLAGGTDPQLIWSPCSTEARWRPLETSWDLVLWCPSGRPVTVERYPSTSELATSESESGSASTKIYTSGFGMPSLWCEEKVDSVPPTFGL